ncbi:hypothetical protein [Nocardiopsis coralliicola]
MRSGRHGAARPPIGVLVRQDRVDFALYAMIAVVALAVMAFSGPMSAPFWLSLLPIVGAVVLSVRRIDRLSRDELRDEELL